MHEWRIKTQFLLLQCLLDLNSPFRGRVELALETRQALCDPVVVKMISVPSSRLYKCFHFESGDSSKCQPVARETKASWCSSNQWQSSDLL